MSSNSGILATVGLNPVPSEGIYPTSTVLKNNKSYNIACYNAYTISFVPPYSQFSIANATLNGSANTSLQKISATNLINGTDFTNQIVMAPIRATISQSEDKKTLSLRLDYPEAEGTYSPYPNINLEIDVNLPAFTSQNFSGYQLTTPFYFPKISSSNTVDAVDITQNYGVYYSFYTVVCNVNESGVKSCTFTPVSLAQIASLPDGSSTTIAIAFVQASTLSATSSSNSFFFFNPSVINQSTIPEADFEKFTQQILTSATPALNSPSYKNNSQRLLGILYFDQFPLLNPQSVDCVFGQTTLVAGSADIKTTTVCNPAVCT
jgi:hypothetical protein